MLATTLPPAQGLLALLGFVALIGCLYLMVYLFSLPAWKKVAQRFPMREVHFTGDSYKKQRGNVGNIQRGHFEIRPAAEGLCIYPSFARRNPCLVPWSAIRRVSATGSSLFVVVDYEQTFDFSLPPEALPIFQAKLSPQLFRHADSPFAAAKEILKDGTQPRWLSAVAGQAIKQAEKEYDKEKRLRGEPPDDVT